MAVAGQIVETINLLPALHFANLRLNVMAKGSFLTISWTRNEGLLNVVVSQKAHLFSCEARVKPEWIDQNGHMNMGYYMVAFDSIATAGFYDAIGLGIEQKLRLGKTTFTLAANIDYLREVHEGDLLLFTTQLIDYDRKRLHYMHCMYQAKEGYLAATNECLGMYIDLSTRRGTEFSLLQMERFQQELERCAAVEPPATLARKLGIRRNH